MINFMFVSGIFCNKSQKSNQANLNKKGITPRYLRKSSDKSQDMNKWKQKLNTFRSLDFSALCICFALYLLSEDRFSTILVQAVEIMADGNS